LLVAVSFLIITACEKKKGNEWDTEVSGKIGMLDWNLLNGILTISGTGEMEDMEKGDAPWYDYIDIIKQVVIEEGVTTIGNYAFCNCANLNSVILPESLTSIEKYVFQGCSRLKEIVFPNSLEKIGYASFELSGLTSLTIPASVEQIDGWAFTKCSNLKSIVFNGSVWKMGSSIFAGYSNSPSIYAIEVKCPPFTVSTNVFDIVNLKKSSLTVPKETKELYESAPVWKNFGTITEKQ
jgi:hypothetical protein